VNGLLYDVFLKGYSMNPKVKAALATAGIMGAGILFSMVSPQLLGWLCIVALIYALYSILATKFEMEDSRKSVENPE
jgi:glycerol uptake facilitator-like aquaporin